jgi:hypothetical protein
MGPSYLVGAVEMVEDNIKVCLDSHLLSGPRKYPEASSVL